MTSVATRRGRAPATSSSGPLTGTRPLIRLILRRDRVWLPVWMLITLGVVTSRANSVDTVYPDAAARQARYQDVMVDVPMFKLFQGPAYADTAPALIAQESFGGATIIAALGAAIFLVRHTRGEEQAGRRELVGASAVGRHAQLAAALVVVLAAGAILAVISAAGLASAGMPTGGSYALGLAVGCAVWIAAGLAAVTAQITESSRAAGATAISLFIGMHFLRGVFDMGEGTVRSLGWLIPNAWLQRTRPYADERWWPFLLALALTVVLVRLAFTLASRRDLGAGLMTARPGPARAPAGLRSPFALVWRLHRPMAVAWTCAAVAIALPTGFAGAEAMEEYADSARMKEWAAAMGGGASPGDAFFAYIAFTTGFLITMYAIMSLLRLGQEENSGHAELLLSTPVDRMRWAAGHLLVALAIPVVLQFVLGLCFGLGSGELGDMLITTLSLVPAVWVMVGIAMAAYGLLRRGAAVIGWGALVVALVAEFGQHLGWPEWTFKALSPFAHVLPFFGRPSILTLAVLTLMAAALSAAGLFGVRRRDLAA
ncbi:ABC transporter permease [Actinomadura rugatobispora]|uniref:ABC transporter permease n=1 Tax=Actinomadura rugatobispora TaxID=1994 RepID=A0ABW1A652_9ACTN|nr:exporter of polyketide antibiotics [Actinomadura rugatobispora]